MIVALVSLSLIALISIIACLNYRQRIKRIIRQLKFINSHDTNMVVSSNYGNTLDLKLADEINKLILHLRELEKKYLENGNRLKFSITSLSHDIRTPLTSLDGYFQLLNDSDSPAERDRYILVIRERISSLKQILDELFTYAKLQDSTYTVDLENVELNKLLYDTAFSFYDDFKRKKIEPKINITEEPVSIVGNYTALMRAIQNIIKNSLVHGQATFSLNLEAVAGSAIIKFSNLRNDTDLIDIDHVFDRFYKADVARKQASTGLGLYIAKEIVEKLEGKIYANIDGDMFTVQIIFKLSKNSLL